MQRSSGAAGCTGRPGRQSPAIAGAQPSPVHRAASSQVSHERPPRSQQTRTADHGDPLRAGRRLGRGCPGEPARSAHTNRHTNAAADPGGQGASDPPQAGAGDSLPAHRGRSSRWGGGPCGGCWVRSSRDRWNRRWRPTCPIRRRRSARRNWTDCATSSIRREREGGKAMLHHPVLLHFVADRRMGQLPAAERDRGQHAATGGGVGGDAS